MNDTMNSGYNNSFQSDRQLSYRPDIFRTHCEQTKNDDLCYILGRVVSNP